MLWPARDVLLVSEVQDRVRTDGVDTRPLSAGGGGGRARGVARAAARWAAPGRAASSIAGSAPGPDSLVARNLERATQEAAAAVRRGGHVPTCAGLWSTDRPRGARLRPTHRRRRRHPCRAHCSTPSRRPTAARPSLLSAPLPSVRWECPIATATVPHTVSPASPSPRSCPGLVLA